MMKVYIEYEMAVGSSWNDFNDSCNRLSKRGFVISSIQPHIKDHSSASVYSLLFQK